MLQKNQIKQIVQKLTSIDRLEKIILFGSYARGEAKEDSDLDLLIIKRKPSKSGQERVTLRNVIGAIGVGVDVLVYSSKEVIEKSNWCSSPIYWALREGKVLYDAKQRSKGSSQTRL